MYPIRENSDATMAGKCTSLKQVASDAVPVCTDLAKAAAQEIEISCYGYPVHTYKFRTPREVVVAHYRGIGYYHDNDDDDDEDDEKSQEIPNIIQSMSSLSNLSGSTSTESGMIGMVRKMLVKPIPQFASFGTHLDKGEEDENNYPRYVC